MKRKLRSRGGMTIIELLAAALVLILLGLMLNTGLLMARRSHDELTAQSETQLLVSTLTDTLSNELRYARDMETGENDRLISYTSTRFGEHTALAVDGASGQLMVRYGGGGEAGEEAVGALLSAGVYKNSQYRIEKCDVRYYNETGVFSVSLSVSGPQGITNESNFSVRCLNAEAVGQGTEGDGA